MRTNRQRLEDIMDAIEKIESQCPESRAAFDADELRQVWIIYPIQIIGEACRSLTPDFTSQHSTIPWAQIIEMRNIVVHEYFRVDLDIVWSTTTADLKLLKTQIKDLLDTLPQQ